MRRDVQRSKAALKRGEVIGRSVPISLGGAALSGMAVSALD